MRLIGKQIIAFVDEQFEDLELWYPVYRVREEGARVHLVGFERKKTYVGKYGVPACSDYAYSEIDVVQYDGVLVPGGWAPDKIRRYPDALRIVQEMDKEGKPIGQICHAGWVLISANMLQGRTVTSTPGIRDDMENAGAAWLDKEVVVDGNLVSARRPSDLPAYGRAYCDKLAERKS